MIKAPAGPDRLQRRIRATLCSLAGLELRPICSVQVQRNPTCGAQDLDKTKASNILNNKNLRSQVNPQQAHELGQSLLRVKFRLKQNNNLEYNRGHTRAGDLPPGP
jgi:hypothetical protein